MRVSYDWLKTMIDIPEDPKTLSDEYIRTGTEDELIAWPEIMPFATLDELEAMVDFEPKN